MPAAMLSPEVHAGTMSAAGIQCRLQKNTTQFMLVHLPAADTHASTQKGLEFNHTISVVVMPAHLLAYKKR